MKIVITNVYCFENRGDAAIVLTMVNNLKRIYPKAEISILSLWPELDKDKYGKNVNVYAAPIIRHDFKNKVSKFGFNTIKFIVKKMNYHLGILNSAEKVIKDADLVISCGGGYLQCRNVKQFFSDFIYHYVQLDCARILKKKYIIFAQTIGPFNFFTKLLMRNIFNESSIVLARERISYDVLKRDFDESNYKLTADVAFLLQPEEYDIKLVKNNRKRIGITVREWLYPGKINRKELNDNYVLSLVSFTKYLIMNNYDVYFMPQCVGPDSDNDLIITQVIYQLVSNSKNVHIIDDDVTPGQLKKLYGDMDYFVGTRMHSNIFSLAELVPTLAISYDYKTDGIMKLAGLEKYVIDINDINSDILIKKFNEMTKDNSIKNILSKNVKKLKHNANLNFHYVQEVYEDNQ